MSRSEVFDAEKVLDKALHTFWQKGYHNTSMQDLVDATKLNRSSIYNSFGSKMALYQLALRKYQKQRSSLLQSALIKAANPREALQLIFKDIIFQILENKNTPSCFEVNCKLEMGTQNMEVEQLLRQSQEHQIHFFEHLIKDGQTRGLINEKQTATEYGHFIFNAYCGLQVTGVFEKNKETLKSIVVNTLRVLL